MTQSTSNTKRLMLSGIVLCLLYLLTYSLINYSLMHYLGMQKVNVWILLLSRGMQWLLLLLMVLYAIKIEKQHLLLWKNHKYKIHILLGHILLLWLAVLVAMIPVRLLIHYGGLLQYSPKMSQIKAIIIAYPLMLPFFAITAGIVEEYIFRGYIQPRLEVLLKSPITALLVSSLLFGGIHFGYGTLVNMLGPFVIGLLFSMYYWKFRNIYVLIFCHIIIDLIALYTIVHNPHF